MSECRQCKNPLEKGIHTCQPETPGQQTDAAIKVLKERRFVLARDLSKPVPIGDEIFAEEWRVEVNAIDAVLAQLASKDAEIEQLNAAVAMCDKRAELWAEKSREKDAEIARLTQELAACYELTGADPDGNQPAMLAPYAVQEVQRLRDEHDCYMHEAAELAADHKALIGLLREQSERRAKAEGDLAQLRSSHADQRRKDFEAGMNADWDWSTGTRTWTFVSSGWEKSSKDEAFAAYLASQPTEAL
jgi:prefoldin subunit 5